MEKLTGEEILTLLLEIGGSLDQIGEERRWRSGV